MPRPRAAAKQEATELAPSEAHGEAAAPQKSAEEILQELKLWPGWSTFCTGGRLPLGKGKFIDLPTEAEPDAEMVGLAYPLAPVEYGMRNERRFPPPTQEVQDKVMFRLVQQSMEATTLKPSYVMSVIYSHINRNARDSPGWQRAFMKAHGYIKVYDRSESEDPRDRYWAVAILGRMMGTDAESRRELLALKMGEKIIAGCSDEDEDVRECSRAAVKGLIQHPEGRQLITYDRLIECLTDPVSERMGGRG
mmetsp:Transcript_9944/g.22606  ORF Transcript_9944/g.22606 Transcript_9944/m.22606 type:complete len:250 (-) Transcript_9944:30-779(-)